MSWGGGVELNQSDPGNGWFFGGSAQRVATGQYRYK